MNGTSRVYAAIITGFEKGDTLDATYDVLAALAGISKRTAERAIESLEAAGFIEVERFRGRSGHLRIQRGKHVKNTSENTSKNTSKTRQTSDGTQCFLSEDGPPKGALSSSDCETENTSKTRQRSDDPAVPRWFVCCVWYDEKGNMWTHGRDGFETYMPCDTKDAAMELAEKHSHMFHKDKTQRYGVLPAVDVCETVGDGDRASKTLHYRYGTLKGAG